MRWSTLAASMLAAGSIVPAGCQAPGGSQNETTQANLQPSRLDASTALNSDRGVSRTMFQAEPNAAQASGVPLQIGKGHEAAGQLEAAVQDYEQAIDSLEKPGRWRRNAGSINAERSEAHRRLAGVFDHLGKFAQADVHYKEAIKLTPRDYKVWNNAGYSQFIQGLFADAERTLRTARRLAPDDPKVAANYGLSLAALGRVDDAYHVLSKAVGPAAAHADIAYALNAAGRTSQAAAEYRVALVIEPDMAIAKVALAKLDAQAEALAEAAMPTADAAIRPADANTTVR
jgi:Flp pilus assembly protein TadD